MQRAHAHRPIILLGLMLLANPASASDAPSAVDADAPVGVNLELALFPWVTQQQIEGPNRDSLLTNELGLASVFTGTYAIVEWLEAGLLVQFDAGRARRATFTRPDASGESTESNLVEGAFWELWTALLVRGRYGPIFAELGWAPLILRHDDARTDLPNVLGETDGVFEGSRSVAFLGALGGRVELAERLDLTLRVQFRIRYLVSRGGKPLADDEENGQMTLWPYLGLLGHF